MGWGLFTIGMLVAFGGLLVSAGIEDARTREIANEKNAAIALLAPLWWWANGLPLWPDIAVQLGVAATLFALFVGAFALGQMGGGDVKLIGAVALWLPFAKLADMLLAMALIGGAITIAFMMERRWQRNSLLPGAPIEIPYGVAIAIGALLVIRQPVFNQLG